MAKRYVLNARTCVICKTRDCELWHPGSNGFGHNPQPVKARGRCCDFCNATRVLPMRIALLHELEEAHRNLH